MKKTYIIAYDEYMGVEPGMEKFVGTYRELLLKLCGYDVEDPMEPDEDGWEVNGRRVHNVSEMTDEELLEWVKSSNGDGQPGWQVYCLEDDRQVDC